MQCNINNRKDLHKFDSERPYLHSLVSRLCKEYFLPLIYKHKDVKKWVTFRYMGQVSLIFQKDLIYACTYESEDLSWLDKVASNQ